MKHLLNDLSNQEKQRILEQYNNSLIVDKKKFSKLIESELGDVKPLLEQNPNAPYPHNKGQLDLNVTENNPKPEDYPGLAPIVEYITDPSLNFYYVPSGGVFKFVTTKNNSKIELFAKIKGLNVAPHAPIKKYEIRTYINENDTEPKEKLEFNDYEKELIGLKIPGMVSRIMNPIPAANKN